MCHIPTNEIRKSDGNVKVYKVAFAEEDYYELTPKIWSGKSETLGQLYVPSRRYKYYSLFMGEEIRTDIIMHVDKENCYPWRYDDELGEGYYHFFKTEKQAREFIHIIQDTFKTSERFKTSYLCILVGTIPDEEKYNEGIFYFENSSFDSIVSKAVYYSGKMLY